MFYASQKGKNDIRLMSVICRLGETIKKVNFSC